MISEHCSTCIGRNSFAIVSNQNMKLNFPHVIEKCSYFVDIRITFFSLRFVLKIQNVKIVYSRLFYAWNHALFMRFSDYVYELCLYWVLKDYDLVLFRKKLWSVCWVNFLLFHRLRLFKVFFLQRRSSRAKNCDLSISGKKRTLHCDIKKIQCTNKRQDITNKCKHKTLFSTKISQNLN